MRDFGGEKWLPQGGSWKPETNMEQLWQVGFRLITHLVLFFGSTVALVMGWTWINSVFGGVTQCSGSLVMYSRIYSGTRNPETRGGCPRKFDPRTRPDPEPTPTSANPKFYHKNPRNPEGDVPVMLILEPDPTPKSRPQTNSDISRS